MIRDPSHRVGDPIICLLDLILLGFYIPRYLFRWADFNMPTAEFKTAKYKFLKLGTFGGREIVLHAPKTHSNDHIAYHHDRLIIRRPS